VITKIRIATTEAAITKSQHHYLHHIKAAAAIGDTPLGYAAASVSITTKKRILYADYHCVKELLMLRHGNRRSYQC
jgi:hypothetical protein